MTQIYYIRHAQPNYKNHDDDARELTEKGLRDRLLVTRYLADKRIDAVLSSPYRRAVDTVGDFAARHGHTVRTVDDFRERQAGRWVSDFDAFCQKQWADFGYKLPDGESLGEVQQRSVRALRQVLAEYAGQRIAIGGHGTALATLLHYYAPPFGYADFARMQGKMPWAVHFTFEGERLVQIESVDLL